MSVRISKKHGVNPTIPICFFCGKEKNEVVLLGKLPGDIEAPRNMWMPGDYEPCKTCQEKWAQGIALIEVTDYENFDKQPPIVHGAYPTGRVAVLKEEAVSRVMKSTVAKDLIKHRKGLIDRVVFERLFGNKEE